jgi:hypothetical protein
MRLKHSKNAAPICRKHFTCPDFAAECRGQLNFSKAANRASVFLLQGSLRQAAQRLGAVIGGRWCRRKSIAAAPAGSRNGLAYRLTPGLDGGPESAKVEKGRASSLQPNKSPDLNAPAQQCHLIAGLNLIQQFAQALPGFPDANLTDAHKAGSIYTLSVHDQRKGSG